MPLTQKNELLLKKLALAMATHPRDTFTELATIVGVSKATLHRIYGTRNDLEKLLLQQSDTIIQGIIRLANSDFNDYIDGLNQLIAAFYDNKELFRWLFLGTCTASEEYVDAYFSGLEGFFTRGQRRGTFRVELNADFLTTMFSSGIVALIDAELMGRIAPKGSRQEFADVFLQGIQGQ